MKLEPNGMTGGWPTRQPRSLDRAWPWFNARTSRACRRKQRRPRPSAFIPL